MSKESLRNVLPVLDKHLPEARITSRGVWRGVRGGTALNSELHFIPGQVSIHAMLTLSASGWGGAIGWKP